MDNFTKKAIEIELKKEGALKLKIKATKGEWLQNIDMAYMLYNYKNTIYMARADLGEVLSKVGTEVLVDKSKKAIIQSKKEIDELEISGKTRNHTRLIEFVEGQLELLSIMNNRGFYAERFRRRNEKNINKMLAEGDSILDIYTHYRNEFGLNDKIILSEEE